MKIIRKSPLFCVLISTGILFTLIALCGLKTIYSSQEYNFFKAPVLSVMFTGINDEIYPWKIMNGQQPVQPYVPEKEQVVPNEAAVPEPEEKTAETESQPEASAEPETIDFSEYKARYAPLKESTYDEYINHISADIYGNMGVLYAASYEFVTVDESYFDDALFIGDSRMVGLHDYTSLSEHADFLCETSLTIHKVLQHEFEECGTVEEALSNNDYGKIYISVGINELGTGTTEDFMAKYTEVVDTLHALEPEAKIFILANMNVAAEKHESDKIFNNNNITARNNAIATLADNEQIFYIDINEVVCDEEGNLSADYTFDQLHLLGVYNDLYKQFLLEHGVK